MTQDLLRQTLDAYASGLDAELALLRQLQKLARQQQEATLVNDVDALHRIADERERTMSALVAIEHEIKPIRQMVSANQRDCSAIEGYADVIALHRAASHLVSTILSADGQTIDALREAEQARRFAVQAIESGKSTLAAYRRVIAPPITNASLLDRRG